MQGRERSSYSRMLYTYPVEEPNCGRRADPEQGVPDGELHHERLSANRRAISSERGTGKTRVRVSSCCGLGAGGELQWSTSKSIGGFRAVGGGLQGLDPSATCQLLQKRTDCGPPQWYTK